MQSQYTVFLKDVVVSKRRKKRRDSETSSIDSKFSLSSNQGIFKWKDFFIELNLWWFWFSLMFLLEFFSFLINPDLAFLTFLESGYETNKCTEKWVCEKLKNRYDSIKILFVNWNNGCQIVVTMPTCKVIK